MSREQILENELQAVKALQAIEHKERIELIVYMLRNVTNGEWEEIRQLNPGLHSFIKQAVNFETCEPAQTTPRKEGHL